MYTYEILGRHDRLDDAWANDGLGVIYPENIDSEGIGASSTRPALRSAPWPETPLKTHCFKTAWGCKVASRLLLEGLSCRKYYVHTVREHVAWQWLLN